MHNRCTNVTNWNGFWIKKKAILKSFSSHRQPHQASPTDEKTKKKNRKLLPLLSARASRFVGPLPSHVNSPHPISFSCLSSLPHKPQPLVCRFFVYFVVSYFCLHISFVLFLSSLWPTCRSAWPLHKHTRPDTQQNPAQEHRPTHPKWANDKSYLIKSTAH